MIKLQTGGRRFNGIEKKTCKKAFEIGEDQKSLDWQEKQTDLEENQDNYVIRYRHQFKVFGL